MFNELQVFTLIIFSKGILIGFLVQGLTVSIPIAIISSIAISVVFYTFLQDFNDINDD